MDVATLVDHVSAQLNDVLNAPNWFVALSGGVDSCVLLDVISQLGNIVPTPPVKLIHVNHGLSPNADEWQQHCQQLAKQYQLPLITQSVEVPSYQNKGPEAAAREARYQVFEEYLNKGDALLLAHHADDQVETFFLRLMRSAGVIGLSGMPQQRRFGDAMIVRPLLNCKRENLVEYARQQSLRWVHDESNDSLAFDRNYIRHSLVPVLQQRWAQASEHILSSMQRLQANQNLAKECASDDLKRCDMQMHNKDEMSLCLHSLKQLSSTRQQNLLYYWLGERCFCWVSETQLQSFIDSNYASLNIENNRHSFRVEVFKERLFVFRLYNLDKLNAVCAAEYVLMPNKVLAIDYVGRVTLKTTDDFAAEHFIVRFRQGGERAHPQSRKHSQRLKKLLQEQAIAPWWRDRIPLIFFQNQLVAVGDYWIEKDAPSWLKQGDIQWQRYEK